MAEVYIKDVVNEALAQVGKSCGKTNKYSAELDKVSFYNYKKNGVADSCSIFVDDMVYRNTSPKTAHNARSVMCEPDKDNCGAGCTQAAGYFKSAKRWISKPVDFKVGDKVFFKKSNGAIYHTGIIVAIGNKITTVEGNTNGGKVAKKIYSFSDAKLAGAGRPKYTGYEKAKAEPIETPDAKPADKVEPVASPKQPTKPSTASPSGKTMTVKVNTVLNVRNAPNGNIVGRLKNGTKVTVYDQKNGWARIGSGKWVFMQYLR